MKPDSFPQRKEDGVIAQQAQKSLVLLDVSNGEYYALDEVGSRVWELADGERSIADIVAVIHQEYDAPPDTVEQDVLDLLQDLAGEGLIIEAGKSA